MPQTASVPQTAPVPIDVPASGSLFDSLAIARQHHVQGRLLEAAEVYQQALSANRESQQALLGLSLIARQTRQFGAALQMAGAALFNCLVGSSEAALAWAHLGHCLFASRQIPQAEIAFTHALSVSIAADPTLVHEAIRAGEAIRADDAIWAGEAIRVEAQIQALVGFGELFSATSRSRSAIRCFERALELRPTLAAAHYGIGNAIALTAERPRQFEEALVRFEAAASIIPGSPEVHFAIGFVAARLGRHAQAVLAYRRAVELRPALAAAWLNLGVALIADGQELLADDCYRRVLAVSPEEGSCPEVSGAGAQVDGSRISAYLNLGHLARTRRRHLDAEQSYKQAMHLACKPDSLHARRASEVYVAFAYLHMEQAAFQPAWVALGKASLAEAKFPDARILAEIDNARGILLLAEDYDQVQSDSQSLDTAGCGEKAESRVQVFFRLQIEEAIQAFADAELSGHKTAASNRGNALLRLGRTPEALEAHQLAVDQDPTHPGARYNLALTQLRLGDFTHGWPNYEFRWSFREVHPRPRQLAQPRWQGESASDCGQPIILLIYGEQGLGDTIQFLRYLTLVIERLGPRANVILEVQAPLFRLLKTFAEDLQGASPACMFKLVLYGDVLPRFTHHCPLLSLPAVFRTTIETIPQPRFNRAPGVQTGYLRADPEFSQRRKVEVATAFASAKTRSSATLSLPAVGLAWAGNPNYRADHERSTCLATFTPLLKLQDFHWVCLQKAGASRQIEQLPESLRPLDASSADQELADTAALIADLDLVITTDTVIAHLAGAMGKPLWLLLPWQSDWRWMQDADTTPWYCQARLFRMTSRNDWTGLVLIVRRELSLWQCAEKPWSHSHEYIS